MLFLPSLDPKVSEYDLKMQQSDTVDYSMPPCEIDIILAAT